MINKLNNNKANHHEKAIKVENLSKTFRIPHEKTTTLKGAALGILSKKNYTDFRALESISFEVEKGEFLGIIGRNGSGKSTLLKILAGIYVPDSGKIVVSGKLSPFLELGVGFNPELTGRENLFLGGAILGLTKEQISAKFDDIVSFSELSEFVDMKLKNYSSGMQVRLAFSLAINAHAEVLLMDEVLAVGDTNFQAKCINEFNKHKKRGKTVVLVSHDINIIQKYCDRAILLTNGRMKVIGKAKDVVAEYVNENFKNAEKVEAPDAEEDKKNDSYGEWGINKNMKYDDIFVPINLRITDHNRKIYNRKIRNDEDAWVEIEGEVKEANSKMTVGFAIYDYYGNELFWSYHTDDKILSKKPLGKGFIGFRARLPQRTLNEGTYIIKMIASLDFERWILDPAASCPSVHFEIQGGLSDSDYWQRKRPGIIGPLLKWEKL